MAKKTVASLQKKGAKSFNIRDDLFYIDVKKINQIISIKKNN